MRRSQIFAWFQQCQKAASPPDKAAETAYPCCGGCCHQHQESIWLWDVQPVGQIKKKNLSFHAFTQKVKP